MAKESLKEAEKKACAAGLDEKKGTVQGSEKQRGRSESVYPAGELAVNAEKLFGCRKECVSAALRSAGKTGCTVSEAKEIVKKFLNKEVR